MNTNLISTNARNFAINLCNTYNEALIHADDHASIGSDMSLRLFGSDTPPNDSALRDVVQQLYEVEFKDIDLAEFVGSHRHWPFLEEAFNNYLWIRNEPVTPLRVLTELLPSFHADCECDGEEELIEIYDDVSPNDVDDFERYMTEILLDATVRVGPKYLENFRTGIRACGYQIWHFATLDPSTQGMTYASRVPSDYATMEDARRAFRKATGQPSTPKLRLV